METEQLLQRTCDTFYYDDGVLKYRGGRCQPEGKAPGWIKPDTGYHCVNLDGKQYKTHRLIFLMFNKYLPALVDHIDRDRLNNKIENLREATKEENAINSERWDNGGVSFRSDRGKWRAYYRKNHKQTFLGYYNSREEALEVVQKAKYDKKYATS